jgi:pimeloyl-ACP methyl ester carboxylesterase
MKSKWLLIGLVVTMLAGCGTSDEAPESTTAEEEVAMEESPVEGVTFRFIETNGITMRIAEAGTTGDVVLLAHGWPESWYSWRHQIPALVEAGYRVVVPEMRGYGKTDAPEDVNSYDIISLAADMTGVLDAVGVDKAHMVGHDWGAIVAVNTVLLHPDRFSSLTLMSVPYAGRGEQSLMAGLTATYGDNFFYILHHNEPGGIAEKEYDADPRGLLSRLYLSPDSPREAPTVTDPHKSAGGWIPRLGAAKGLPDWLEQEELDYYVAAFEESGFRGGVNYYRNFQRNWDITEHLAGVKVEMPSLFIAGAKDMVIRGATAPMLTGLMSQSMSDLRDVVIVPEMGHWIQQEDPKATNDALIGFLQSL